MAVILPYLDKKPHLGRGVFLAEGVAVIGDVRVGENVNIWFNAVLRGDMNHISIGPGSNVQDGTVIHVHSQGVPTCIGADVTIGHNATIHACTLEDCCLIGMGATVLDGATVETGALVAAGALIAPGKRVKSGELWAGNPARAIRPVNDAERRAIEETPAKYRALARDMMRSTST